MYGNCLHGIQRLPTNRKSGKSPPSSYTAMKPSLNRIIGISVSFKPYMRAFRPRRAGLRANIACHNVLLRHNHASAISTENLSQFDIMITGAHPVEKPAIRSLLRVVDVKRCTTLDRLREHSTRGYPSTRGLLRAAISSIFINARRIPRTK